MPTRPKSFRPRSRVPLPPSKDKAERDRFYTGVAWRKCRAALLAARPLCHDCEAKGLPAAATVVHHDRERLERPDLALDMGNLVALCGSCHTRRHNAPGGASNP